MKHRMISSCYYPTLTILLDDNRRFLTNISFELDAKLAYRMYENPQQALQYLKEDAQPNPLAKKCLSIDAYSETYGLKTTYHSVNIDLEGIYKEIYNNERFNEPSVVIVDYSMPVMNGLEFCKLLEDSPIKKIMVTGEADEALAVHAFNEGFIDKFILKNSPQFGETLNKAILELQQQYFNEQSHLIIKNIVTEPSSCLDDPAFIEFFYRLCNELQIAEYYLIENSGSFLLLTTSGKPHWLIVKTHADLLMYLDMAEDSEAPEDVLDSLSSGKKIPYFSRQEDYHSVYGEEWPKFLYPAKQLIGKEMYYYALLPEPPSCFNWQQGQVLSYKDFLGKIWPPLLK